MLKIIFETHATSADNETRLASGWKDVDLSDTGMIQAQNVGQRYADNLPSIVYCSDLQRSYKTAAIAFKDTMIPIIIDSRLRECDYGDLTQAPKSEIENQKPRRINEPFPGGESYKDTSKRIWSFIEDIKHRHDGKAIMIIGHRATQYGLEEHILKKQLSDVVVAPWVWQPGWMYEL